MKRNAKRAQPALMLAALASMLVTQPVPVRAVPMDDKGSLQGPSPVAGLSAALDTIAVVVGGEKAYNYGGYLNSSLEEILPVLSKPSEYKGGRNLVLVLDISPSARDHGAQGDILGNAISILRSEKLRDANVAAMVVWRLGWPSQNRSI